MNAVRFPPGGGGGSISVREEEKSEAIPKHADASARIGECNKARTARVIKAINAQLDAACWGSHQNIKKLVPKATFCHAPSGIFRSLHLQLLLRTGVHPQ